MTQNAQEQLVEAWSLFHKVRNLEIVGALALRRVLIYSKGFNRIIFYGD